MTSKKQDSSQKLDELSLEERISAWEKKVDTRLVNNFRKEFMWSPVRTEALKKAKAGFGTTRCAECGCEYHTTSAGVSKTGKPVRKPNFEVDHKEPVGGVRQLREDLNVYRAKALPKDVDALQVLCKACHAIKTKQERKNNASRKRA